MDKIYNQLIEGLKDFAKTTGIKRCVLGLSGGLDSAAAAVLAARAFGPGNVFGVAMPSRYTAALSNDIARELAGNLGINFAVRPIEEIFETLVGDLHQDFPAGLAPLAKQNLQPRIRGVILMAFANQLNAAALTTGNRSEIYTGYCTLYGDTCGALAPLGDLYKTEVYKLAAYINKKREIIPQAAITRPPTAELAPGQTDQDDLPPYEILDAVIEEYVFKKTPVLKIAKKLEISQNVVDKVIKKINASAFKRAQMAPAIKIKR
jgi:NAD+ synthetase